MRLLIIVSSIVFIFLSLHEVFANDKQITICGTGDSQELLRQLASAFSGQYPDTSIVVPDSIGSSGGIKMTALGKCDLGRVARPLKEREFRYNLSYKIFAYSPVVFFTNANVRRIEEITTEQASGIFSGKLSNWRDIGGSNAPIYVAHREKGDSSRRVLEQNIPAFATMTQQAGATLYSTQEIVDTVTEHPGTIGYTSFSAIKKNDQIKVLAFSGIRPEITTLSGSPYPLLSPFALVWRDKPAPVAQQFLHFLATPAAHAIINKYGAIPAEGEKPQ
jgi:phosphate transport system substrate-binding protein